VVLVAYFGFLCAESHQKTEFWNEVASLGRLLPPFSKVTINFSKVTIKKKMNWKIKKDELENKKKMNWKIKKDELENKKKMNWFWFSKFVSKNVLINLCGIKSCEIEKNKKLRKLRN